MPNYTQKEINAALAMCVMVGFNSLNTEAKQKIYNIKNQNYNLITEKEKFLAV